MQEPERNIIKLENISCFNPLVFFRGLTMIGTIILE